jgi:ribA/ribD-fused uncharacterized protein
MAAAAAALAPGGIGFDKKQAAARGHHTETKRSVLFWKPPCCLGNWAVSPYRVTFQGHAADVNCSEMAFMWAKAIRFGDAKTAAMILAAKDPSQQKKFGRLVSNFDQRVWDAEALDIMTTVVLQKFQQHADYAAFLLATEGKELVECSPLDRLWGIGLTAQQYVAAGEQRSAWKGKNLLGAALTSTRTTLRQACKPAELFAVTAEHMSGVTFRGLFDDGVEADMVGRATVTKEAHALEEATDANRVFVVSFGYVPLLVTLNRFRAQSFLADTLADVDRSQKQFYSISEHERNVVVTLALA